MVGTGVAVAAISDKGCFTHSHSVNSQAQYLQGVSKKMPDSEIWLLGAYRDCLLLTMILGTFV